MFAAFEIMQHALNTASSVTSYQFTSSPNNIAYKVARDIKWECVLFNVGSLLILCDRLFRAYEAS